MASITIFAISGMRRKSGPLQAVSSTRSMARNARPETIAEGKLRLCGRLPWQAPCEEGSLADRMIVWQSAAAEGGHEKNVGIWRKDSHKRQPADCQSAAGCQPAPHLMPPVLKM